MVALLPADANGRRAWLVPAVTGGAVAVALMAAYLASRALAGGVLDGDALIALGAKVDSRVAAGEWWRLVVSVFLHAGGAHVAMNASWLALFVAAATALFGPARALATALLAGVAGQLASFVLAVGPSVGASGAVYGLVGAVLVAVWRRRARVPPELRWRLVGSLGAATVVLLLFPLTLSDVDHAAHLGGLGAGAALAALPERRSTTRALSAVAIGVALAALLAVL